MVPSDYYEPLERALSSQTPTLFGVPHSFFLWLLMAGFLLFMFGFWPLTILLAVPYVWGVYQTARDPSEMVGWLDQASRSVFGSARYDP